MSYSQGGLIQATDYNNFIGANPAIGSGTINAVWSTGSGAWGYGQTALSQSASSAGLVTATQWSTMVNTLNSILIHQSGSGSGITAPTSGTTINYLSTLATNIGTAYTNARTFASNAAVTTGSALASTWTNATTSSTLSRAFGARAAFASADQARYFFNAGGRLKFNISGAQSSSTTARTNAVIALCTDLGGVSLFAANTNGGRTGTGGTLGTNATSVGYYTATYNANVTMVSITSTTSSYTSDNASITVNTNGTQGSNNDRGLYVDFWATLNSSSGSNAGGLSFDDSIGVSVTRSIDISYPETTNLSNTWGTITVSLL